MLIFVFSFTYQTCFSIDIENMINDINNLNASIKLKKDSIIMLKGLYNLLLKFRN